MIKPLTAKELRRRKARAAAFVAFRRKYLLKQARLAEELKCSERTIQAIEASNVTPRYDLQRRFAELKRSITMAERRAA